MSVPAVAEFKKVLETDVEEKRKKKCCVPGQEAV